MLAYTQNKYANFFWIVTGYFSFVYNISKRKTEVYHKMGLVVSYKIVLQALNTNGQAVLRMLCKRVNIKQFFLSYDNINFYKKVQDQRVHNKNYQVVYIAGYICFMKGQKSLFCYTVDYKAINKLLSPKFLLAPTEFQQWIKAIRYTLFLVLSQYFGKKLCKEHLIINRIRLSKYKK